MPEELIGIVKEKDIDLFIKKLENFETFVEVLRTTLLSMKDIQENGKCFIKESRINFIIKSIGITLSGVDVDKEIFIGKLKQAIKKAKIKEEDLYEE